MKPLPKINPETAPFWQGCLEGELRLQHCTACGHVQFPPRKLCSSCFKDAVEWRVASGKGNIVSWSAVTMPGTPEFAEDVPFISILVRLAEGPQMLSVLRDCADDTVDFDLPVEVVFEERANAAGDTAAIPYFRPVT